MKTTATLPLEIEAYLIERMVDSKDSIISTAQQYGYEGDIADSDALLEHLSNTALDHQDYGILQANSERLNAHCGLIEQFGSPAAKERAFELASYDYNA